MCWDERTRNEHSRVPFDALASHLASVPGWCWQSPADPAVVDCDGAILLCSELERIT
jgi:hypothetical protein